MNLAVTIDIHCIEEPCDLCIILEVHPKELLYILKGNKTVDLIVNL